MKRYFTVFFLILLLFGLSGVAAHIYANGMAGFHQDDDNAGISSYFVEYEQYDRDRKFPDIALYDMADRKVSLFQNGQPYRLVNIWASWCASCITEIPALMELEDNIGQKNFDVVFVSLDFPDKGGVLRQKMKRSGLPEFDSLYVKSPYIWEDLSITGIPASFLIDPDGDIMYAFYGNKDWADPEIAHVISAIISG